MIIHIGEYKPIFIDGYDTGYTIYPDGRVYSISEKLLKPRVNAKGYFRIGISHPITHKMIDKLVHRLVAEAFIPNPENKSDVNHIDGNKSNNCVSNLEWTTRYENMKHAYDTGLINICGENNSANKYKEKNILKVCDLLINTDYSLVEISKMTNIPKATITMIYLKRRWKHLTKNMVFRKRFHENQGFKDKYRDIVRKVLSENINIKTNDLIENILHVPVNTQLITYVNNQRTRLKNKN